MAIHKIILKDRHGRVIASDSFASIESAKVTIVDGVGTPSATGDYDNGVLSITMRNVKGDGIASFVQVESSDEDAGTNTWKLTTESGSEFLLSLNNGHRGNGIVSIEQTASSTEDDGINEWTITETDGNETIISVKNGSKGSEIVSVEPVSISTESSGINTYMITTNHGDTYTFTTQNGGKGETGDTGIYDPSSPDAPDFEMATTTGQSTTKAMTQKAVTDEIARVDTLDNEEVPLDNLTVVLYTVSGDDMKWVQASDRNNCVFLPVSPGETYIVSKTSDTFHAFLVTTDEITVNTSPSLAGGLTEVPGWTSGEVTFVVPNDARFMYIRRLSNNINHLPTVRRVYTVREAVTEIKEDVAELQSTIEAVGNTTLEQEVDVEEITGYILTATGGVGVITTGDTKRKLCYSRYRLAKGSSLHIEGLGSGRQIHYGFCSVDPSSVIDLTSLSVDNAGYIGISNSEYSAKTPKAIYDVVPYDAYLVYYYYNQDWAWKKVMTSAQVPPLKNAEIAFAALKYSYGAKTVNNNRQFAAIVHVTDSHGDEVRTRMAFRFANLLHADVVNSGDSVAYYSNDDISYLHRILGTHDGRYIQCIGNHDGFQLLDNAVYTKHMAPLYQKFGWVMPNDDNDTYCYMDDIEHKIRYISYNQWQDNGTTSHSSTNVKQAQVDFLINALMTVPSGYGVIITMHAPDWETSPTEGYTKFYPGNSHFQGSGILVRIVDAFISGASVDFTYNYSQTVTVSADFSQAASHEFIAYITGHLHWDAIHHVPDTQNLQLCLCSTTICAWVNRNKDGSYGTDYGDYTEGSGYARIPGSPTEYLFNVYVIDRYAKKVKVVRVGADMRTDLSERMDYMVIPYAE